MDICAYIGTYLICRAEYVDYVARGFEMYIYGEVLIDGTAVVSFAGHKIFFFFMPKAKCVDTSLKKTKVVEGTHAKQVDYTNF